MIVQVYKFPWLNLSPFFFYSVENIFHEMLIIKIAMAHKLLAAQTAAHQDYVVQALIQSGKVKSVLDRIENAAGNGIQLYVNKCEFKFALRTNWRAMDFIAFLQDAAN